MFRYLPPKWIYNQYIKDKYDVEIAFLEGITTKLISGSTNPKSKKIAWVHTDLSSNHLTRHYFKKVDDEAAHYKKFDEIICVSEDAKSGFENLFHINHNLRVIYNPIDTESIVKKSKEEDIEFDDLTVCTAGRLTEVKGVDRLIRVHAKLRQEGYPHLLQIIGSGLMEAELKKLSQNLGVSDSVQFKGFLTNPYPYIKACDIFVSPSRMEGFSLVVAEALILGRPVVATKTSGPDEILAGGKYGKIVENSEEGLYQGLRDLLENVPLREHYKKMAKVRRSFFNLTAILQDVYEVID
jgi:glycosyltransferase involved in cell wall biosynthesis